MSRINGAGEDRLVRSARIGQAAVIELFDRLARDADDRPRALGRLWRLNLAIARVALGDPARAIDATYSVTEELVGLHREFAQRLLDTVESQAHPVGDRSIMRGHLKLVRPDGMSVQQLSGT